MNHDGKAEWVVWIVRMYIPQPLWLNEKKIINKHVVRETWNYGI